MSLRKTSTSTSRSYFNHVLQMSLIAQKNDYNVPVQPGARVRLCLMEVVQSTYSNVVAEGSALMEL